MTAAETTLYLIRHGATPSNEETPRRLQGCGVDTSLSSRGRLQARQVAGFLQAFRLDAVYCSPLKRARETATQIATRQNREPAIIESLREVNVGSWERLDWNTIRKQFPEDYRRFIEAPETHGYAGGESFTDVLHRVSPAFEELLSENTGKRIAVVAHSVVNRVWLASLAGVPLGRARELPQDNCCINVVRYRDGQTRLLTLNAHFHVMDHGSE